MSIELCQQIWLLCLSDINNNNNANNDYPVYNVVFFLINTTAHSELHTLNSLLIPATRGVRSEPLVGKPLDLSQKGEKGDSVRRVVGTAT